MLQKPAKGRENASVFSRPCPEYPSRGYERQNVIRTPKRMMRGETMFAMVFALLAFC